MNKSSMIMTDQSFTKTGTAGGTLTIILAAIIDSADVIKTITLAALGAVVSYVVSLLLKRITKK
ncbi:MAG TPA: hypothetical protein PKA77_12870 [Chitinophagaceae bacterium]|jgi:hypothetical protein|nr:hypothetical protein [Chitinophagaceae bacterium]HMU57281.1 hypothetical protein [Chitinophagaceae bacterium]